MEQNGNRYRSSSGQKDGAKITAEWTEAEAKNVGRANATTDIEQATAEIEAKYTKQLKSGYYEKESDIDKVNDDTFWPMLALSKAYKEYRHTLEKIWSQGIGVQTKYNGERMILKKDGAWSRTGERHCNVQHIEEAFAAFFQRFPDAILDGEAYNYDLREHLNEVHSLMSKKTPTQKERDQSKALIRFYIYDGFGFPAGKDEPVVAETADYLLRKKAIDNAFFAPCFKERYKDVVGYVKTWVVHSEAELEKLYESFLADKQEGAILRILNVGYQRKRCKYLLKYKPLDDAEFRIVAVMDGDGKDANLLSTVTCEKVDRTPFKDGKTTFDAKFKGKQVDARKAWKDGTAQALVGKVVTIYYNGLTGYGKPNYARLDWNNYNKGH
jgi:ATP-dependent DNA ligase